ncbi:DEAD/DEAH box helicase [Candidatus Woesearchaeota archaeon]|nr:DEAD/DEAH box helicase [Candidatus Woesearchaeota archaeon]
MEYKGLVLDRFQEDAIISIEKNHSVVVSAPTGSGKTLIADYIIKRDIEKGIKVVYTAPIKALSNQKYREFCQDYGKENIGLLTGDISKNQSAPILIMTTEIYRNMALTQDEMLDKISYVIFDEIHYINDIERGYVWEESIIFSKDNVRFLCLSATIPNAAEFASWIASIKGHKVDVIRHDKRQVPLHKSFYDSELGITSLDDIKEIIDIPDYKYLHGRSRQRRPRVNAPNHVSLVKEIKDKLPCFFFSFSRQKCQNFAFELSKASLFPIDPRIGPIVREKLSSAPKEINELKSTKLLRQVLPYGIAFHHAGLIPVIKELVEELFSKGLIKVLYTTETFAVGINMPAKSVCFESLRKFDGVNFRFLNSKEYFQIAGRAGRRGIDHEGFVYAMVNRRDFDYSAIMRMSLKDVDPIKSQFKLSVNTVLNMVNNHTAVEIDEILSKNFFVFQKYGKVDSSKKNIFSHKFAALTLKLGKLGYIKDGKLTEKGLFSSRIYSEEIITGELFSTSFYLDLNEYQIMLLIACICYESREKTEFYKTYHSEFLDNLKKKIKNDAFISKDRKFNHIEDLTSLIHPCYHSKTIFDIVKNTNLLEGDLIRFFRQMLDRISQVKQATNDMRLQQILKSCQEIILNCLRDIDAV